MLLAVYAKKTELFACACFGRPLITAEKGNQWFQLGFEEAF